MILKFFLFYANAKTLKLYANKVLYFELFDGG